MNDVSGGLVEGELKIAPTNDLSTVTVWFRVKDVNNVACAKDFQRTELNLLKKAFM